MTRAQLPQRAYKRRRRLHILLLSLLIFLAVLFWLWRTVSGTIKTNTMQGHEWVDGKLTMHYLPDFRNWMRFVASGCRESSLAGSKIP